MFNTLFDRSVARMLESFRRSVDQLLDDFYGPAHVGTEARGIEYAFSPMIESGRSADSLFLRAILPGVSDNDVKVSVRNKELLIEGERKAPAEWNGVANLQMRYGKFYWSLPLPDGVDLDRLSCRLHDGVLDVQVPFREGMRPRQIPIATSSERKAIAA